MAMTVTGISHRRNYFKKSVRLTLIGTEFPPFALTDVYLTHKVKGTTISCSYSYVWGPEKVYVRFILAGKTKGLYDITVNYLGTLATLERAFRIQ
jgi:hypothetical protein